MLRPTFALTLAEEPLPTLARRVALHMAVLALLAGCHDALPPQPRQAAPNVLHLSFGVAPFELGLGAGMRLPIAVVSSRGDTTQAPARLLLVSRNPAVVRIDSGTFLQSTGMGSTWVVASLDTAGQALIDSMSVSVSCTMELTPVLTPATQTLAVGASFTPSIRLFGCGGRLEVTDTFHWSASDSTVVRVDSLGGTTTGLRPGQASVFVRGTRYGVLGGVSVTVYAP
jgi:hypothetical protein